MREAVEQVKTNSADNPCSYSEPDQELDPHWVARGSRNMSTRRYSYPVQSKLDDGEGVAVMKRRPHKVHRIDRSGENESLSKLRPNTTPMR